MAVLAVLVVLGTHSACTLSRPHVQVGSVRFTVVNRSVRSRAFAVAGRRPVRVAPGRRVSLRVRFPSAGMYPYRCGTRPELLLVEDAPHEPVAYPGPGGTVVVTMVDGGFSFAPATIPAGRVTFVVRNTGSAPHDFAVVGVARGPFLDPGASASETVYLEAGHTYTYVSEVPDDWAEGMEGTFTPAG